MKKLMTTACLFVVTIVAIVTFIAPTVFGQEKKTADVNPTPEAITARVDKLFAQWDKPDSPGCAVGVIRDGKLIYTRGYGLANLEYNLPLTSKSVLDIGSVSKQFTATSILLLAQQGKLSPDDDIRKYIPEIPAYTRPITIRQLLNHTSGIREYLALMDLASPDFTGRIESANALAIIARQKETNFPPGDESAYSNSGYFLLSVIVKRISGKTLREFAEVNIFAPLGMKNTHFHDAYRMIVPLRATGYSPATKGFRIAMSDSDVTGAGGLYTTIEDLLLWDQNFYHKKVGGQALQDELHRVGVLTNGEKLTYASGIVVAEYRGLPMAMHGGAWAGYRSMLLRFPQQSFSIVCLCNRGSATPWNLAYRVADEYLGELMTARSAVPTGVMVTEVELKQRSGLYRNVRTPDLRRIDLIDGTLAIAVYGDWKLTALDANRFIGTTAAGLYEVTFQPDSPGGGADRENGGKTR